MALASNASMNGGRFTFPSQLDKQDATVADEPAAKDTTANTVAMLISQNVIIPAICVSPGEDNPNIRVCANYKYDTETASVRQGARAPLWDVGFRADFTTGIGHLSYANLQPAGKRRADWDPASNPQAIVWGNRGPEITSVEHGPDGSATPHWASSSSNAFLMQGAPGQWRGNLAHADGFVEAVSGLARFRSDIGSSDWGGYQRRSARSTARACDVWHYDEPDDADGSANTYLGIFVKAGPTPLDFKAIWD